MKAEYMVCEGTRRRSQAEATVREGEVPEKNCSKEGKLFGSVVAVI